MNSRPGLAYSRCIRHDALLRLPRMSPAPNLRAPGAFGPVAATRRPPFLPSLSNPIRVLHTPSRAPPFLPSPGLAPFLYLTAGEILSGSSLRPSLPSPTPSSDAATQHVAFPLLAFPEELEEAEGRKIQSGFLGRPPVRSGWLRRPIFGGGSGPGFARARRPPPGAGASGRGASRRLVIAGARRRLGPRVLRCPRARPGAPPSGRPGGATPPRPPPAAPPPVPRRPPPTRAPRGHCGEPEPSARELLALRRLRPAVCRGGPGGWGRAGPGAAPPGGGGLQGRPGWPVNPLGRRRRRRRGLGSRLGAHVPPPSGPRSCGGDAGRCRRRLGGLRLAPAP